MGPNPIWSHLLKKSLMENFIFYAVIFDGDIKRYIYDPEAFLSKIVKGFSRLLFPF